MFSFNKFSSSIFEVQKKNFEYEKYKDYDVQDIMIECLNDETIYDSNNEPIGGKAKNVWPIVV